MFQFHCSVEIIFVDAWVVIGCVDVEVVVKVLVMVEVVVVVVVDVVVVVLVVVVVVVEVVVVVVWVEEEGGLWVKGGVCWCWEWIHGSCHQDRVSGSSGGWVSGGSSGLAGSFL